MGFKNKIFLICLSIFSTIFFIYIFFYFYYYFSLEKQFSFLINKNHFGFYKKYINKIHHLRIEGNFPYSHKNIKKSSELLFDVYNNKNKNIVLFQGDSWFDQLYYWKEYNKKIFEQTKHSIKYINAGIGSYSPSLMLLQYEILEKDFNIFPEIVVAYIDQTDIFDEVCRYRTLKKYSHNNKLVAISPDKKFSIGYTDQNSQIERLEIFLSTETKLKLAYYLLLYKSQVLFNKIFEISNLYFLNTNERKLLSNCKKKESLYSFNNDEIIYFNSQIKNYLDILSSKKNIRKILLVTHFHKISLNYNASNNTYDLEKVIVSDIIDNLIKGYNNIYHLNFSKEIKIDELKILQTREAWLNDEKHLNKELHTNYFLKKIIERVDDLF